MNPQCSIASQQQAINAWAKKHHVKISKRFFDQPQTATTPRAVAYFRQAAKDNTINSIAQQQEQVRAWAKQHSVDIIQEFVDAGKAGLHSEGRPAFTELMRWVKDRTKKFTLILCLDASRWGRFQDIELAVRYSAECWRYGKHVIFVSSNQPQEGDPLYPVYVQFERFLAAKKRESLTNMTVLEFRDMLAGNKSQRQRALKALEQILNKIDEVEYIPGQGYQLKKITAIA